MFKMKLNEQGQVIDARGGIVKKFDLTEVNAKYLESFRDTKYPQWNGAQKASWAQYKCSIGNFLQVVGKDAVEVTEADLAIFVSNIDNENTKANRIAHIKSFLSHLINNNIEGCRARTNKFTLIFADIVPAWFFEDKSVINWIK
jgi:hypothetical protein